MQQIPEYLTLRERASLEKWKREIVIEKKGKMFTLRTKSVRKTTYTGKKRGEVTAFSPKARNRMLRFIAAVDWDKVKYASLMTLTIPDSHACGCTTHRNMAKSRFWRDMENYLGHKVAGIFRWEFEERKSGEHKGREVPHLHVLLFEVIWIPWHVVEKLWTSALGLCTYARVDIRRAKKGEIAALYIAKYMAKVQFASSLVNLPYRNKRGLHWGIRRKELIPISASDVYCVITEEEATQFYLLAAQKLSWVTITQREGFTLFGDMSEKAKRLAVKMGLTFG